MYTLIAIVAVWIAAGLSADPALAENDKKHLPWRDHPHGRNLHDSDRVPVAIGGSDRRLIFTRLEPHYMRKCPPGLAKKRNGCLPPGQAKKYVIGHPLPPGLVYWDVPPDVLAILPPAPAGAYYLWADRDILLISEASKKVLDAVVILSALN
jgi:hypothetical protein